MWPNLNAKCSPSADPIRFVSSRPERSLRCPVSLDSIDELDEAAGISAVIPDLVDSGSSSASSQPRGNYLHSKRTGLDNLQRGETRKIKRSSKSKVFRNKGSKASVGGEMVARNLVIHYGDDQFLLEWDTDLGFEVLQYQVFSVTSVPPEDQRILVEDGVLVVSDDFNLESISNKLRLVSIQEEEERERSRASKVERSDEELARRLQAEEEALWLQQYAAIGFEQRIRPYLQQVLMYEDPIRQDAARKTVPIVELEEKALVSLAKEGNFKPSKDETDHAFLLQLLFWFKQSFRWVNSPSCDKCGGGTNNIGMGNPEQSEIKFGAYRVELYRCNICSNITRFPRYNDPWKLLETKCGRCGEWANCFTLYCRAFCYEARLILDFTDHVWTECFSQSLGRWMHLDPCEGVYNNPLLYEKGWNKKLNYVIAIANNGVYDVTKRYTREWHEALARRNLATEIVVASVLSSIREECRAGYSPEILQVLVDRDQKEVEEIEREVHLQVDTSISLPGRQSGSFDWRRARLECGSTDSDSFSCYTCPVRLCVDDHVTNIYTSFALLRSQILVENLSQPDSIRVLEMLQRLLTNLKNKSFKNRASFLELDGSQISDKVMLSIETLFAALSLKLELGNIDGNIRVSLCGDPVRTSIALPVALDVIKEVMDNMKGDDVFLKEMQFPRANRLSSGTVLASGEELPFGIASSAFDGIFSTKWEEPNGAKGCWLIYKVSDECMYELQSYDLVSANDASERDPMDWIVEGNEDGGSSWNVLDEQKSQTFEKRFQRKTFTVNKKLKSKAFRFKFLAVRDAKETSRLQIGGIALYAKSNNN